MKVCCGVLLKARFLSWAHHQHHPYRCQGKTWPQITAKNVQAQIWPCGAVVAFLMLSLHLNVFRNQNLKTLGLWQSNAIAPLALCHCCCWPCGACANQMQQSIAVMCQGKGLTCWFWSVLQWDEAGQVCKASGSSCGGGNLLVWLWLMWNSRFLIQVWSSGFFYIQWRISPL